MRGVRVGALLVVMAVAGSARADHTCVEALAPSNEKVEDVLARARSDFAGGNFEAAAKGFRDVAIGHADHPQALGAAQLYLETLNELGKKDPACWDDFSRDVPELLRLHCSGGKRSEECDLLARIHADVRRLAAQRLVERADKATGEAATALYASGGQKYLDLFHSECTVSAPVVQHCDEIAYNASRAFRAAHDVPHAIAAARELINLDASSKRSSPLAAKMKYELGGIYQSIAMFAEAADWYERYAVANPTGENAPRALSDAVILRLGLGEDDRATRDAEAFVKAYGSKKRLETAAILYALAAHDVDREAWDKARARLASNMKAIDEGSPDITIAAHALYGRVLARGRANDAARIEYAKARDAWHDPAEAERAIKRAWPDEDEWRTFRRVAKALNAVGEAYWVAAEERRKADVDTIRAPAFTEAKLKAYADDKRAAIARVEPEYIKILDLKPVPPPKWVILASASVSAMWTSLADDVARVPDALKNDKTGRRAYENATRPTRDSVFSQARPSATKCIDLSVKYQFWDPTVDACRDWLARRFPSEHWRVDELVPGLRESATPIVLTPLGK
jgi:hypothetical protein